MSKIDLSSKIDREVDNECVKAWGKKKLSSVTI